MGGLRTVHAGKFVGARSVHAPAGRGAPRVVLRGACGGHARRPHDRQALFHFRAIPRTLGPSDRDSARDGSKSERGGEATGSGVSAGGGRWLENIGGGRSFTRAAGVIRAFHAADSRRESCVEKPSVRRLPCPVGGRDCPTGARGTRSGTVRSRVAGAGCATRTRAGTDRGRRTWPWPKRAVARSLETLERGGAPGVESGGAG